MILIKNTQRKITINENKIKSDVAKMLHLLNYDNFDIGIWFTTNQTIKKYNKKYRKKDKPTDILSFPFHQDLKAGQKIRAKTEDEKNLGDIIISAEFAQKDALNLNFSLPKHLQILLAHGIAHLLGYEHETERDFIAMQCMEKKLISSTS